MTTSSVMQNPTLTTISSAHKALSIFEIQQCIFDFDDSRHAARCATVCKAWTEMALNRAWYKIRGFRRFCSIIAPISTPEQGKRDGFKFMRRIRVDDMTRFSSYAKLIKSLKLATSENQDKSGFPCKSAFRELSELGNKSALLPNLQSLSIWGLAPWVVEFLVPLLQLHTRLERVALFCTSHYQRESDAGPFLKQLEAYSPGLRSLEVFNVAGRGIKADFSPLSNLTGIEEFRCADASEAMPFLRTLPRLRRLSDLLLLDEGNILCGPHHGGCFPALLYLVLTAKPTIAVSFISQHANFRGLKAMYICTDQHDAVEDTRNSLAVISEVCERLEVLQLSYRYRRFRFAPEVPLTKDTIAPVTSLHGLRELQVMHGPFSISDGDLLEFLAHFSSLRCLELGPDNCTIMLGQLEVPSLRVLHEIAQCQPDLEYLALYLATSDKESEQPSVGATPTRFKRLRVLNVGASDVGNPDHTAVYLSKVLPSGCEIETRLDEWGEVKKAVHLLTGIAE